MPATKVTSYETTDWTDLSTAPNTVTANGNRSYSLVFNSVDYTGLIQPGTRIRTTRTVAAPTQCTSLNGTTQYYNRASASVAGMTFTDDFVVSAWVKMSSYGAGSIIASRYNGTSGWSFYINSVGQITLVGLNGGAANYSQVVSYQSIPINKWVHVAAQLDMSTFTATTTTSYVMIDGVDVPASVSRAGTNPTALVQAGNLEIGSQNGGTGPFPGKIAQVAIYNAKVTQATILASCNQTLTGTETSLISAYSFNNTINDLNTTNANNLTANGSAVATNADSPFSGRADGTETGTLDFGIVQSSVFSTNTTLVVQVPEGCTIPTSGGVTTVSYSGLKAPYGMPLQNNKWRLLVSMKTSVNQSSPVATTWYNPGGIKIVVPIGSWNLGYEIQVYADRTTNGSLSVAATLSTANNSSSNAEFDAWSESGISTANAKTASTVIRNNSIDISSATTYYANIQTVDSSITTIYLNLRGNGQIFANVAYL